MKTRTYFPPFAAFALSAGLLLGATQAQAHAQLVKSMPAANTTVASPKQIALTFSEKLEPKFSGGEVMKADGGKVAVTSAVNGKAKKAVNLTLKAPLAPGAYKVIWHVVSADGHRMNGDYSFTVR